MRYSDRSGDKYGRLLVLSMVTERLSVKRGKASCYCLCDCGRVKIVSAGHLRNSHTASCGCLSKETTSRVFKRHGFRSSRIYRVWSDMVQRCENDKDSSYKYYGGRGIRICEEWRRNPQMFIVWAQNNGWERGLQIDREDNNGDYSPGNCRFVTPYVNNHNKRRLRVNNKTGYTGITFASTFGKYRASVANKFINQGRNTQLGTFDTLTSAVTARNNFIIKHNLPHRIQEIK